MAAAERARAGPQRIFFGRLRKPKAHMQITAMTPAQMLHIAEYRGSARGVNGAIASANWATAAAE